MMPPAPTYRDTIPPQVKEPDYRGSPPKAPAVAGVPGPEFETHGTPVVVVSKHEAAPDSTLTPKELADFCAQLAGADMLELQERMRHHGLAIVRA